MPDYGQRAQESVNKAFEFDKKKKSMWDQLKELVPAMTWEERTKRMKEKAREASKED